MCHILLLTGGQIWPATAKLLTPLLACGAGLYLGIVRLSEPFSLNLLCSGYLTPGMTGEKTKNKTSYEMKNGHGKRVHFGTADSDPVLLK